jgi:hypothetical protein
LPFACAHTTCASAAAYNSQAAKIAANCLNDELFVDNLLTFFHLFNLLLNRDFLLVPIGITGRATFHYVDQFRGALFRAFDVIIRDSLFNFLFHFLR